MIQYVSTQCIQVEQEVQEYTDYYDLLSIYINQLQSNVLVVLFKYTFTMYYYLFYSFSIRFVYIYNSKGIIYIYMLPSELVDI